MGNVLHALFITFQDFCRELPKCIIKKFAREKELCDFLMSTHRLYFSSLTKRLVTVVIASSACCETAVQQRLSCFMFTDSRDQEESKLPVCSTIRPIDWLRRIYSIDFSHDPSQEHYTRCTFYISIIPAFAFSTRYKISAI